MQRRHSEVFSAPTTEWGGLLSRPEDKTLRFPYQPLDSTKSEIRILSLAPIQSAFLGTVTCTLRHVSLDDPELDFEAISYCWGDAGIRTPIKLGEHEEKISRNAELALRTVALPDRPRDVWLDSLCIDQANLDERSSQVGLMGRIYSQSKATLVYLGEADSLTQRGFENITDIAERINDFVKKNLAGGAPETPRLTLTPTVALDDIMDLERLIRHEEIARIYGRPWFQRLWVIQEVALAQKARLFCGAHEMDMLSVLDVAGWLWVQHRSYCVAHFSADTPLQLGAQMSTCRQRLWRESARRGVDLVQALEISRTLRTGEQRDKVFGMLGLLDQTSRHPLLTPDYTKPLADVYRDATILAFQTSERKDLFSLLQHVSHRDQSSFLLTGRASWVPHIDRSYDDTQDAAPILIHEMVVCMYDDQCDLAKALIKSSYERNILRLAGIIVGTIMQCSTRFHFWKYEGLKNQRTWLHDVVTMHVHAASSPQHRFSCTLPRLLIADTTDLEARSSQDDWEGYRLMLERFANNLSVPRWSTLSRRDIPRPAEQAGRFHEAMHNACRHRIAVVLDNGLMGLVPQVTLHNDIIVMVQGSPWPLVLRPVQSEYIFIGICYVDGIMPDQEHYEEFDKRRWEQPDRIFNVR